MDILDKRGRRKRGKLNRRILDVVDEDMQKVI